MRKEKRVNRARSKKSTNNKEYKYYAYEWADIDWDYGWNAMPDYTRGFKPKRKFVWKSQWREWRSWKHNRKTQWKDGNK